MGTSQRHLVPAEAISQETGKYKAFPTSVFFQPLPIFQRIKGLTFCKFIRVILCRRYSNMRIHNGGMRAQNLITLYCSVSAKRQQYSTHYTRRIHRSFYLHNTSTSERVFQ